MNESETIKESNSLTNSSLYNTKRTKLVTGLIQNEEN